LVYFKYSFVLKKQTKQLKIHPSFLLFVFLFIFGHMYQINMSKDMEDEQRLLLERLNSLSTADLHAFGLYRNEKDYV
jgi:hypothetical protein